VLREIHKRGGREQSSENTLELGARQVITYKLLVQVLYSLVLADMLQGAGRVQSFLILNPRPSEFSSDASFPTNFFMTELQRKNLGSNEDYQDYLIDSVIGVQKSKSNYFRKVTPPRVVRFVPRGSLNLLAESSVGRQKYQPTNFAS
jgi:hypothetical protein